MCFHCRFFYHYRKPYNKIDQTLSEKPQRQYLARPLYLLPTALCKYNWTASMYSLSSLQNFASWSLLKEIPEPRSLWRHHKPCIPEDGSLVSVCLLMTLNTPSCLCTGMGGQSLISSTIKCKPNQAKEKVCLRIGLIEASLLRIYLKIILTCSAAFGTRMGSAIMTVARPAKKKSLSRRCALSVCVAAVFTTVVDFKVRGCLLFNIVAVRWVQCRHSLPSFGWSWVTAVQ